jgi:hypothetical protein
MEKALRRRSCLVQYLQFSPSSKEKIMFLKYIQTLICDPGKDNRMCLWRNPNTPALVKIRNLSVDHKYNT